MGDPKNHAIKSIGHFYSRRWRPSRQTALTGGPGNELSILWVKIALHGGQARDQHQKGRRQTKHGFLIGSADRAAQDLTLSRYKEPAEPLEGRGRRLPQSARAAASVSQIGPIGARWLGIAARLACTHTGDGEPITQRCAHSVDTCTSAWLNTRFRTGRPWLWRVSQTRRTSMERIMPRGTNDCPTELSSRVTRRHKNSSSERGFDSPQG